MNSVLIMHATMQRSQLKFTTTNGFNFRIIKSLMASWGDAWPGLTVNFAKNLEPILRVLNFVIFRKSWNLILTKLSENKVHINTASEYSNHWATVPYIWAKLEIRPVLCKSQNLSTTFSSGNHWFLGVQFLSGIRSKGYFACQYAQSLVGEDSSRFEWRW